MPLVHFRSSCINRDLKKTCLILACLNLVIELLRTVIGIVGTAAASLQRDYNDIAVNLILAITIIVLLVVFGFSIVLLVGLVKEIPRLLKAYLIFSSFYLGIWILFIIYEIVLIIGIQNQQYNSWSNDADKGLLFLRVHLTLSSIFTLIQIFTTLKTRAMYYQMSGAGCIIRNCGPAPATHSAPVAHSAPFAQYTPQPHPAPNKPLQPPPAQNSLSQSDNPLISF